MKTYTVKVDGNGTRIWYQNGDLHLFHCENGPAIEYADGDKVYYLNDEIYSYEDWLRYRKILAFI